MAIDATVLAGTTAPVNMRKQNRVAEWAGKRGMPLIFLSDNDGGRLPDLLGWRFSGVPFDFRTFLQSPEGCPAIPRITAVLGPSFGDAALHAAIADLVVMKRDSAIALSGPPVIKGAIGEDISNEELGGPAVAHETSGSAHVVVDEEAEAIDSVKRFLSYLPDAADLPAPVAPPAEPARDAEELLTLVPAHPRRGYDMRKVLQAIVDRDSLFNWGERFGRSLITALARIDGQPVGVVASPADAARRRARRPGADQGAAVRRALRHVQHPARLPAGRARADDRPRGRARRHPALLRAAGRGAGAGDGAEGRGRRAQGLRRRAHRDGRAARQPEPAGRLAGRRAGLHGARHRRAHGLPAAAGRARGVRQGVEARDARAAELEAEWAAESQPWEAAANIILDDVIDPRDTRETIINGIDFAWGTRPRVSRRRARMSTVEAHITGTVWTVEVSVGDEIDEGDVVVIIESMKMEMPVEAEQGGIVAEILCASGQAVEEGQALVRLA